MYENQPTHTAQRRVVKEVVAMIMKQLHMPTILKWGVMKRVMIMVKNVAYPI